MEKFKSLSSVVLLLLRDGSDGQEVLMQRRQNTGYADGLWDFSCAGHVEEDETMLSAVLRECKEELGVYIFAKDVKFVCLVHKRDRQFDLTYYSGYFTCRSFSGQPTIVEPEKCSEIKWFPLNALPQDIIPERKQTLDAISKGESYFEFGW